LLYNGLKTVELTDEELANFYNGALKVDALQNQYLLLKHENEIVDKFRYDDGKFIRLKYKAIDTGNLLGRIKPRNVRQELYMDLLLNDEIPVKCAVGVAGCLSGDTLIPINRNKKGWTITIENLYNRLHRKENPTGKWWRKDSKTYVQYREEKSGTIRLVELVNVIKSGEKVVYGLETEGGNKILATRDHKFFTEKGWLSLSELKVGDLVWTKGTQQNVTIKKKKPLYRHVAGLINHPHRVVNKKNSVVAHHLVIESDLNKLSYAEYIEILRDKNGIVNHNLRFIDPSKEVVHHIDGNYINNEINNLKLMPIGEHRKLHAYDGQMNNVLFKSKLDKISSIMKKDSRMTYDIILKDEPHNFVANNFIVHNSGKTFLATAYAMQQLKAGEFQRMVIIRNNISVQGVPQLGALPGDATDKLKNSCAFMSDIIGDIFFDDLIQRKQIEIAYLGDMRSRSIGNAIILCNESQNLNTDLIKMIITRVGEGSKIIFDFDLTQIDHKTFEKDNGMVAMVEGLKGNPLFGIVELDRIERSAVARLAELIN
jgi:predicted ribonuclease YlaK